MSGKRVSAQELKRHSKPDNIWIVVSGKVYDITEFAPNHPGGSEIIYQHAGSDATAAYSEIHAPSLIEKSLDNSKHIGYVDEATAKVLELEAPRVASTPESQAAKPDLTDVLNLFDFEEIAYRNLTPKTLAYWGGAANDCLTHKANRAYWERITLRPHLLRDVAKVSTKTRMLGFEFEMPLFTSPFGVAKLAHPEGELEIARAAVDSGITMCYSTYASYPFSEAMEVVPKGYPMFFQLYVNRNRKKTERMLKEVVACGAKAIFITIDLPVVGKREADERIKSTVTVTSGNAGSSSKSDNKGHGLARTTASEIDPAVTWEDLKWIKDITGLPLILKGIQTAHDAKLALEAGCDGIFLSNHGGRAVDTAPPAIMVLLELHLQCPEVFGKMEIFVDGGIRRGTDILKAICLGATGVAMGRPFLYSNMYGKEGVKHLVAILKDELETAMQQCGLTCLEDASPDYVNTSELDPFVRRAETHPYARKVPRPKL